MRAQAISADTQVSTDKITLWGYALTIGGDNDGSIEIYDEADDSKTASALAGVARIQDGNSQNVHFNKPLLLKSGCYVNITGTNARAVVYIE